MTDWIPVTEETPDAGEPVLVLNAVREWVTIWRPGLVSPMAKYPVTHVMRLPERPYPASEADRTHADEEIVSAARRRYTTDRQPVGRPAGWKKQMPIKRR